MITIDVKTGAVTNSKEHEPQKIGKTFGYNVTAGYIRGWDEPDYPMPAIRYVTYIDAEFVAVWEFGVECVYYHDDYETVWN